MSITLEGLKDVARRKRFRDIADGTSFVGSFRCEFGVWHKADDLTVRVESVSPTPGGR